MVYPMYRQGNSRLMISVIECPCADVLPMLLSISIWQFLICIPGFGVLSLMICPSPLSGDLSNCCFSSLCTFSMTRQMLLVPINCLRTFTGFLPVLGRVDFSSGAVRAQFVFRANLARARQTTFSGYGHIGWRHSLPQVRWVPWLLLGS